MNGKQIGTRHKKISKVRKIMRHTLRGLDDEGKPFEELLVFDKIKSSAAIAGLMPNLTTHTSIVH